MITEKMLKTVVESWTSDCSNIMDSQKKYNEAALEWSKKRIEQWIGEMK